MKIKNNRIIINENNIEQDVEKLQNKLRNFLKSDARFSKYDIGAFVEYKEDCCNEDLSHFWHELIIHLINYDVEVELSGKLEGCTEFVSSIITFSTDSLQPQLVMNLGEPDFYYVLENVSSTITGISTWGNTLYEERVEDVIIEVMRDWYEV